MLYMECCLSGHVYKPSLGSEVHEFGQYLVTGPVGAYIVHLCTTGLAASHAAVVLHAAAQLAS